MRKVIFDLGGVVLDWNPDAILENYYEEGDARALMKRELFQHPDWLHMDRGLFSEADVVSRVQKRTGRPADELHGLLDAVRASLSAKQETVALIERLSERGVPLYCLSNMPATTFAYLKDRHDFWPRFRGIVISGEIRMMKPEREIFEYLIKRYNLVPGATAFVDDLAPNIEAARALGLHGVLFRNAAQCGEDLDAFLGVP